MTDVSGARTLAIGGLGGASLLVIGTAFAAAQPVAAPGSLETPVAPPSVVIVAPAAASPPRQPQQAKPVVPRAIDQEALGRFLAGLAPTDPRAPTPVPSSAAEPAPAETVPTPPTTVVAETGGS